MSSIIAQPPALSRIGMISDHGHRFDVEYQCYAFLPSQHHDIVADDRDAFCEQRLVELGLTDYLAAQRIDLSETGVPVQSGALVE